MDYSGTRELSESWEYFYIGGYTDIFVKTHRTVQLKSVLLYVNDTINLTLKNTSIPKIL